MSAIKTIKFGHLEINLSTCPTNKKDFDKKFIGKVPDLSKAWEETKKALRGVN